MCGSSVLREKDSVRTRCELSFFCVRTSSGSARKIQQPKLNKATAFATTRKSVNFGLTSHPLRISGAPVLARVVRIVSGTAEF